MLSTSPLVSAQQSRAGQAHAGVVAFRPQPAETRAPARGGCV
jgi:hypothetical protein